MTSEERKVLREALKASGFERYASTYDPGNGMYTESWVRKDGKATGDEGAAQENTVQISWGVRSADVRDIRVFGRAQGGPTHLEQADPHSRLAWCGVKKQFRHWSRPGAIADVDCPRCLTAIRQDRPRAWRSR